MISSYGGSSILCKWEEAAFKGGLCSTRYGTTGLAGIAAVAVIVIAGMIWAVGSEGPIPDENHTTPDSDSGGTGEYEGEAPPEIVLAADNTTVGGVRGSYCWSGRCVDTIGPAALVADRNATTVLQEVSYRFAVRDGPTPESYRYTVHWRNNTIIADGDASEGFMLPPMTPGIYIVVGHGRWEEGDASYVFKISITS